jgi:hypothetical protein
VSRTFLGCAATAILALPCLADSTSATPETLIRLEVSPAPAPRPALRYQLLPELREMSPGNPVPNYMRCSVEQQGFFLDKETLERREDLLVMPLKELAVQGLQVHGQAALRQADRAARLDTPDWQILTKLKADGVGALIPDVPQLRPVAAALKVRFRAEVALRRFDDAIGTAKTLFAMSRHLSEHPTFVGNLVGIAVAYNAIGPMEEMLEQPGCPNLYWALTNLPDPLVRLDKGAAGERLWTLCWLFRDLDDRSPMSAEQIQKVIADKDALFGDGKPVKEGEGMRGWLDARTKDEEVVRAARRRLVEHGLPEERLLRFPASQVILLDEKREFEVRFDDLMKAVTFPAWQFEAETAGMPSNKAPALFADILMPAVSSVRRALGRLEQRIALLRHVEALRLYASVHKGALPASLSEIPVRLPDDPFTGKSFRYEVIGNTAHLRGTPPRGAENDSTFRVHYEVTLQK